MGMRVVVCLVAFLVVASAEVVNFGRLSELYRANVSVDDITFTLYTRRNGDYGVPIYLGNRESLEKAGFDPKLPVKVVTHGYMASDQTLAVQGLRKSFLARSDCNFISVDWSKHARNVLYEEASLAVKTVGAYTSKFVKFLKDETHMDIRNVHALGHSLGAHVMSHISNEFPNEKVGRISGLDPAGPIFENAPPSERLDPEDAHFVDAIHTSTIFLGTRKPMGTVDFYPNGGNGQPGCNPFDFFCNHRMSHFYFSHTVRSNKSYVAVKCETLKDAENGSCNGEKASMGIGADTASPGIYFAEITEPPPSKA